jgi:hypothetical protein
MNQGWGQGPQQERFALEDYVSSAFAIRDKGKKCLYPVVFQIHSSQGTWSWGGAIQELNIGAGTSCWSMV